MGELRQHYIRILVNDEQEDAIRDLFRQKNWLCIIQAPPDRGSPVVPGDSVVDRGSSDCMEIETDTKPCDGIDEENSDADVAIDMTIKAENCSDFRDNKTHTDEPSDNSQESKTATHDSDNNLDSNAIKVESHVSSPDSEDVSRSDSDSTGNTRRRKRWSQWLVDIGQSNKSLRPNSGPRASNTKKTDFKCTFCDVYLASHQSLVRHSQRWHNDEWFEFKCKDCPEMFKTVEELYQHRNEARHKQPIEQPKRSQKKKLSPEELEKLGLPRCPVCGKVLSTRDLLKRHIRKFHPELLVDPCCQVCGAEFKTPRELFKHKREQNHNDSVTLLKTYMCEDCGKILKGGYHSFTLHQKYSCSEKEEAEPQAVCDICGSLFKSEKHVRSHKQKTHTEAPVVCDICGTICKNQHSLTTHKKRHDDKYKKYVCNTCGKAFITKELLKMHIRTHTKEKPFKCPYCTYRCAVKPNVQKHALSVHKTPIKASDVIIIKETVLPATGDQSSEIDNITAPYNPQKIDTVTMFTPNENLHQNMSQPYSVLINQTNQI